MLKRSPKAVNVAQKAIVATKKGTKNSIYSAYPKSRFMSNLSVLIFQNHPNDMIKSKKRIAVVLSAYQFMEKFASKEKAVKFLEKIRWPKGVICLHCQSKRITERKSHFRAEVKTSNQENQLFLTLFYP